MINKDSADYQAGYKDGYSHCKHTLLDDVYNRITLFESTETMNKLVDIYDRGDMPELIEKLRLNVANNAAYQMLKGNKDNG